MGLTEIKLLWDVASAAFGFVQGHAQSQPAQCYEKPPIVVPMSTDPDAGASLVYYIVDKDYCDQVSEQEWKEIGQPLYDAYEGHHSKSAICKSIVSMKERKSTH